MIPWLESHTYNLGGLTLQTWGTFVALGYLVGAWISARRAKAKGLKPHFVWDAAFWMFIAAFIGARLFHAIFYDPTHFIQHPLDLIDPRYQGFAMFGGLLGAIVAFAIVIKKHKLDFQRYADATIWGLPWGIMLGRIGCFLIHDHPGTLSHSLLAVQYPGGARHDLGLYLSIGGLLTGLLFLVLDRKSHRPGFFLYAFFASEAIQRLGLDFYRIADTRYLYLTPTQWFAIPLLIYASYGMSQRWKPKTSAA
ncbi:MAG: prolipoprotein diacylglyceryl transferase family protein [Patescibacteria group bacterium]